MKKSILILLMVSLVFSLAACAPQKAATHMEGIKQAGVIKVGTSADYAPFESVDKSGNKVGIDIDIMNEVAKRLGVKVEWVDMPFDSLIAAVQEGKIDAAISAFNYSEERAQKIDFSDPYFTTEDSFLVKESFADPIAKAEDVAKYKVGVQTGTVQDSWLTDNLVKPGLLKEENLFRYDRVDQAALDLKSGRIDVLMSDSVPAEAIMKQQGGLKIVFKGILSGGPVNIVLKKGDKELVAAVNDIIKKMKAEGFIDQVAQKHLGIQ